MSDNRYYVNYAGLAARSHLTVFLAFYPPPLV